MLGGVPDDEADDLRALLEENEIDYYEVPASFMGVSPASLWLQDASEYPRARALIDHYQIERSAHARSEYARLGSEGRQRTLFDSMRDRPVRFFLYLAIMAAILYFSLSPFLNFGK